MTEKTTVYRFLQATILAAFRRKLRPLTGTEYLPPSGGYILAANHVDWLDGFFLAAAFTQATNRPVRFLTATNNYWWTTVAVQIPPETRGVIVDQAVEALRAGLVIANFPEGYRNSATTLLPGKTGTVRMAMEAGVPVVPVGIICDYGQTMAQSVGRLFAPEPSATISFGQPLRFAMPVNGLTKEAMGAGTVTLMAAIARLCHKTT